MDEFLTCDTEMKATEQYLLVVLFIMLYKVVLTFESVDEILKCDHYNNYNNNNDAILLNSNESY